MINIDPPKPKVEIIRMQDTLKYKQKPIINAIGSSRPDESQRYKTDKERMEAAQRVLFDLKEKQRKQTEEGYSANRYILEGSTANITQNSSNNVGIAHIEMALSDGEFHATDDKCK